MYKDKGVSTELQTHEVATFSYSECYCKIVIDDFVFRGAKIKWPIMGYHSRYSPNSRCICNLCNHIYYMDRLYRKRKEYLNTRKSMND